MSSAKKISVAYTTNIATYLVMYPLIFISLGLLLAGIIFVGVHEYSAFWLIPVLIISVAVPALYYYAGLTKWRIWAFENVADIFELENSKDTYPLLLISETTVLALTQKDKEKLRIINERLNQPPVFEDDPDIPATTSVYYSRTKMRFLLLFYVALTAAVIRIAYPYYASLQDDALPVKVLGSVIFLGTMGYLTIKAVRRLQIRQPLFTISNEGIESYIGFYEWKDILNENSNYYWSGGRSSPYYELNYDCPGGKVSITQRYLDHSPLDVQHLLYIYRGRYDKKTGATTTRKREGMKTIMANAKRLLPQRKSNEQ